MTIDRRSFSKLGLAAVVAGATAGRAQAADKVVRIGFQKYGKLVLLKSKGTLEQKLAPHGYTVAWTEFPSGPPLLEALNAGAVDFGNVGETPPVFAQAAGIAFYYVAYEPPAPRGEAILLPKDSPIKTVADLKGRKIALNKGSNVHYFLVKVLEEGRRQILRDPTGLSLRPPMPAPRLSVAASTPGSSGTRTRPQPRPRPAHGPSSTAPGSSRTTSSISRRGHSSMRAPMCSIS